MSKKVVIIGASGHGKVIADIIQCCGDVVLGFLDDSSDLPPDICHIPILGRTEDYVNYPEAEFIIGIGSAAVRKRIAQWLADVRWYTAIHPSAVISPMDTTIGEGSVVMAGAVVNPSVQIGKHCIINTGASVDHDNNIGDYCHISVGAHLAGLVTVDDGTWIGIGAAVSQCISICKDCMIGAGAVVIRNITTPGTYAGIPARRLK
ncbi:MAG: acetyltransferase [Ruminococcaceae bacterium]|nr:acetyltransferase [Oscillospiraceae bacterium]MBQ3215746.1 acetyltransferase [Oscillospiraceae bacterium]